MKLFSFSNDKNKKSDEFFNKRLNSDLNYLGFDEELKRGFLFFLGYSINVVYNKYFMPYQKNLKHDEHLKNIYNISNLYSTGLGEFADYDTVDDYKLCENIYSINHILVNHIGGLKIDDYLKKVKSSSGKETLWLKTKLNEELTQVYSGIKKENYKLNEYHNLIESFLKYIGKHLLDINFNYSKSYEVGFAIYSTHMQIDEKGAVFMTDNIINKMSPLYMSLIRYPFLYYFFPKEFDSNHIFSSTLQMFYGGIEQRIVNPIHKFHQLLFYKKPNWKYTTEKDSSKFSIKFDLNEASFIQATIFKTSIQIRNTDVMEVKDVALESGEIFDKTLIESKIKISDFYIKIIELIIKKYNIYPSSDNIKWNNLGDFIQYICIMFYEASLHSIVLKELNDEV